MAWKSCDGVEISVVLRWKKGPPPDRNEPWFLIADLAGNAAALTELYGRRMAVEELFRDDKSLRNGWALPLTQLSKAERLPLHASRRQYQRADR